MSSIYASLRPMCPMPGVRLLGARVDSVAEVERPPTAMRRLRDGSTNGYSRPGPDIQPWHPMKIKPSHRTYGLNVASDMISCRPSGSGLGEPMLRRFFTNNRP